MQRRQHQIKECHCHEVVRAVCEQSPALSGAEVKKPCNDRRRATENSQQQTASHAKQAGPGNRKDCFFPESDVAAEKNEPPKFRNERTIERGDCLSQFATDEALASCGKQGVPVTSQGQRIDNYLQTQAGTGKRQAMCLFLAKTEIRIILATLFAAASSRATNSDSRLKSGKGAADCPHSEACKTELDALP